MSRSVVSLLLLALVLADGDPRDSVPMSLCDLAKDFGAYRDKLIAVRGVYYYGLRNAACPQKCANRLWPSFIELNGSEQADWVALSRVEKRWVELEAKKGKRFEIWVTAVGRLETRRHRSRGGPCGRQGIGDWGYGHLGVYPAQLVVKRFVDIEIKENPKSPYDYANMYHGPL